MHVLRMSRMAATATLDADLLRCCINETTTKHSRLYDLAYAVAVLSDNAIALGVAAASCIDCA
jgi:hypothetical protein